MKRRKPKRNNKPMTFTLPDATEQRLRLLAERLHTSMSAVIVRMTAEFKADTI